MPTSQVCLKLILLDSNVREMGLLLDQMIHYQVQYKFFGRNLTLSFKGQRFKDVVFNLRILSPLQSSPPTRSPSPPFPSPPLSLQIFILDRNRASQLSQVPGIVS